jgi:hypothetical protein
MKVFLKIIYLMDKEQYIPLIIKLLKRGILKKDFLMDME